MNAQDPIRDDAEDAQEGAEEEAPSPTATVTVCTCCNRTCSTTTVTAEHYYGVEGLFPDTRHRTATVSACCEADVDTLPTADLCPACGRYNPPQGGWCKRCYRAETAPPGPMGEL